MVGCHYADRQVWLRLITYRVVSSEDYQYEHQINKKENHKCSFDSVFFLIYIF
jgi:hypothetical protein